jgi:hypothetical protein
VARGFLAESIGPETIAVAVVGVPVEGDAFARIDLFFDAAEVGTEFFVLRGRVVVRSLILSVWHFFVFEICAHYVWGHKSCYRPHKVERSLAEREACPAGYGDRVDEEQL